MLKIITIIILSLISIFILFSTFYFWYSAFKGKRDIVNGDSNKYYAIFIGSLVGVGILSYLSFDGILFFIPETWGNINDDGDFFSYKSIIAGFLSVLLTFFFHSRPFKFINFIRSKED
ncbi:MAG: hypothetical protein QY331_07675 [Melioribacteraceae bacterium]|nr:MAG: hypothetical protein QY331_07675 [Melioribacteraceae bacterium]